MNADQLVVLRLLYVKLETQPKFEARSEICQRILRSVMQESTVRDNPLVTIASIRGDGEANESGLQDSLNLGH
ncbi:hypothetical protein [Roseimaritima multifibrata]|uniref:hypothetical protein n=1 Tax=Roseimaritima multifibrata TaxID=1930274 RepID=UPI001FE35F33|nr:hypothetical protein [Roseimaritima multifibrata]